MADKVDLSEMDAWLQQLSKMETIEDSVIDEALMAGAKICQAAWQRKAPPDYKGVPRHIHRENQEQQLIPGALRKAIEIGEIREGKNGKSIVVVLGRNDHAASYYAKFFEYGTSQMPAKPSMRPAYRETKLEIANVMIKIVSDAVTAQFKKGG
jgi:HK97 gp10 family phage protein